MIYILFYLIYMLSDEYKLCFYRRNTMPIKVVEQGRELFSIIRSENWGYGTDMEMMDNYNYYDMVHYRGEELVGSVFLLKTMYYGINKIYKDGMINKIYNYFIYKENKELIKRNIIEIYTLIIKKEYRGRGIAKKFVIDAIMLAIKEYNLDRNDYLGLHLNPEDKSMSTSFVFYSSLGFNKCGYARYGPSCYRDKVEEIETLKDPKTFVQSIKHPIEGAKYLVMFCKVKDFGKKNYLNRDEMKILGEQLREHLRENVKIR